MNTKTRIKNLERKAGPALKAQIEDESWKEEFEEYICTLDQLVDTIPEPYATNIVAEIEAIPREQLLKTLLFGGFFDRWSDLLTPESPSSTFYHAMCLARIYQADQSREPSERRYNGPLQMPGAVCEILAKHPRAWVDFKWPKHGGTECEKCHYWIPIVSCLAINKIGKWEQPLLDECPVCGEHVLGKE